MEHYKPKDESDRKKVPSHEEPNFKMVMAAGVLFIILLGLFTWIFNYPFT